MKTYILYVLFTLLSCYFFIHASAQCIKIVKHDTIIWIDTMQYTAPPYKIKETPRVMALVKRMEDKVGLRDISTTIRHAQIKDTISIHSPPYITNGTQAFYPGGETAFIHFLQAHMQLIGKLKVTNTSNSLQVAKVCVNFQIEQNGTISDVIFTGDVDHLTEVDLVRAMKLAIWKPAKNNGKPVAGGYFMYIAFVNK